MVREIGLHFLYPSITPRASSVDLDGVCSLPETESEDVEDDIRNEDVVAVDVDFKMEKLMTSNDIAQDIDEVCCVLKSALV